MNSSYNSSETIIASYHEKGESNEEATDGMKIILTVAYVIILLFSFIGNSFITHIVHTRRKIRKNPFNWLLVNTANKKASNSD